ncbi:MAG: deoxyguanosinetriphosphate triphosphohydrolase [Pseudomonadota bacterium]
MSDIESFAKKIRESLYERERSYLGPLAKLSLDSAGRALHPIDEKNEFRLCFQRDRDRIIHSKAFRRLKGKTQVFLSPISDHYRTRLTHTLEVSQISRTVARALKLNEDLTEAVALGHDLGHTPFGHFGERALGEIAPGGFHHARQSERIARRMNLTLEVCEGIVKHSKGKGPILDDNMSRYSSTLEGQVVRVADIIAYVNHDLDDAVRAGLLSRNTLPKNVNSVIGQTPKENMTVMVSDVIMATATSDGKRIYMSDRVSSAIDDLRTFLFKNVYEEKRVTSEFSKVYDVCSLLYKYFVKNPDKLLKEIERKAFYDDVEKVAVDYISGMTDNYAYNYYLGLKG